ncbi:MAG: replicative DNA helicase [Actinobacteria bacterium]|nr:replicative DNA helicase [Actinomycetota bacterium]
MQGQIKKTNQVIPLDTSKLDRVPPYNLEAEESVLGSMLISKEAIITVLEILSEEDFYRNSNREIFNSIKELFTAGEPADVITVADHLKKKDFLEEVGGNTYIHSLVSIIPLAANAEHYARIVKHNSVLRKLIYAATEIATMGYEVPEDLSATVDKSQQLIFSIYQDLISDRRSSRVSMIKDVLSEVYEQVASLYDKKSKITGIPTGFVDLDKLTSGLQNSDLVIIASRPGMGKTSFALGIARNAAIIDKIPVAIFSLEMSKEQIAQRLMCSESRIDLHRLRSGSLRDDEWVKLAGAIENLAECSIYIDDAAFLTIMDLRSRARMLASSYGIKLIIVDYLQLLQSGINYRENRVLEVTEISRNLKSIAKELKIPVIAISQLSREVEKRERKKPVLADLRESGAIEQDADLVMFIYREDYYDKEVKDQVFTEVNIAKHRNGPTGVVKLKFLEEYTLFVNATKSQETEIEIE